MSHDFPRFCEIVRCQRWTHELRQALAYNADAECLVDNGEFWIGARELVSFFDVMYVNWNPGLLKYSSALHGVWEQVCAVTPCASSWHHLPRSV